ncbi:MAG: thiamine-phosphate kinase [Actinobacteria bacterium]|nr:thiamine-phosphate kinase [Actinomycetota bacterium]
MKVSSNVEEERAVATIADLGERGVIELVRSRMPAQWASDSRVRIGVGDDAAVLTTRGDCVLCTDAVVEGVHFRDQWSTGADVGVKLAARNFIDVHVMGGHPTALVVSLTAPADTAVSWVEDFADGLVSECTRAGAVLVGGDTTAGWSLVASATALGDLRGKPAVTRAGAQPGDVLALAGTPGRAAAGLAALMAGAIQHVDATLIAAHTRPQPDYVAAEHAVLAGATAMIDTSDGLLVDLGHIARASSVTIDIEPEALPVNATIAHAAEMLKHDLRSWQYAGGEDHLVAATFPHHDVIPDGFVAIGTVSVGAPEVLVRGEPWVGSAGYEHFR